MLKWRPSIYHEHKDGPSPGESRVGPHTSLQSQGHISIDSVPVRLEGWTGCRASFFPIMKLSSKDGIVSNRKQKEMGTWSPHRDMCVSKDHVRAFKMYASLCPVFWC